MDDDIGDLMAQARALQMEEDAVAVQQLPPQPPAQLQQPVRPSLSQPLMVPMVSAPPSSDSGAATAQPPTTGTAEPLDSWAMTAGEHPIQNTYAFHYMRRTAASRAENYEKSIKKVSSFDTVEAMWRVYNHLVRPNELPNTTDYHLFKEGIKPIWEDAANRRGGKWMVRVKKGLSSHFWEELLLAMVGEQFDVGNEICGAVMSIRFQEDIISVWNRNADNEHACVKVREVLRRVFRLPAWVHLEYKRHDSSIADNSSFRNTQSWSRSPRFNPNRSPRFGAQADSLALGGSGGGGPGGVPRSPPGPRGGAPRSPRATSPRPEHMPSPNSLNSAMAASNAACLPGGLGGGSGPTAAGGPSGGAFGASPRTPPQSAERTPRRERLGSWDRDRTRSARGGVGGGVGGGGVGGGGFGGSEEGSWRRGAKLGDPPAKS
jgi:translation initiation factor 4E